MLIFTPRLCNGLHDPKRGPLSLRTSSRWHVTAGRNSQGMKGEIVMFEGQNTQGMKYAGEHADSLVHWFVGKWMGELIWYYNSMSLIRVMVWTASPDTLFLFIIAIYGKLVWTASQRYNSHQLPPPRSSFQKPHTRLKYHHPRPWPSFLLTIRATITLHSRTTLITSCFPWWTGHQIRVGHIFLLFYYLGLHFFQKKDWFLDKCGIYFV